MAGAARQRHAASSTDWLLSPAITLEHYIGVPPDAPEYIQYEPCYSQGYCATSGPMAIYRPTPCAETTCDITYKVTTPHAAISTSTRRLVSLGALSSLRFMRELSAATRRIRRTGAARVDRRVDPSDSAGAAAHVRQGIPLRVLRLAFSAPRDLYILTRLDSIPAGIPKTGVKPLPLPPMSTKCGTRRRTGARSWTRTGDRAADTTGGRRHRCNWRCRSWRPASVSTYDVSRQATCFSHAPVKRITQSTRGSWRTFAGRSIKRSSKVSVSMSCSACTRGRPSSCGRRSEPVRDPSIGSASGHAPGGNTGGRLSPLRAGSRSYRSPDRQASHGLGVLAC